MNQQELQEFTWDWIFSMPELNQRAKIRENILTWNILSGYLLNILAKIQVME